MTNQKLCHCGKPLHYTDPQKQKEVEELVANPMLGEFVNVPVMGGRTYRVQRHYIALHGIKGKDLAELGFEEIKPQ